MATFTVFCQDANGTGTIWIDSVEADTPAEAGRVGQRKCVDDWGYDDGDDVHVLGIAEGDVKILMWDDIE